MAGAPRPFRAERYALAAPHAGWHLAPVDMAEAEELGRRLAQIEPWSRYPMPAERLARGLWPGDAGAATLALRSPAGALAGVAVVRHPWLAGPYVQLLAVLPEAQGRGLGTALLAWMEAQGRAAEARNLWICVSHFNTGAERLYRRWGFEPVAMLDDLIQAGFGELLMRKRI